MPLPFQPVRLRYGYADGDTLQPIPSVDPDVGGNGLFVKWSEELEDPKSHHANSGGISMVWGPSIGSGALVDGTVSLWIRDLWAPHPAQRTEIQVWLTKARTSDNTVINTRAELFSKESYAPLHNDDLVWDAGGAVVADAPGHRTCTKHVAFGFTAEEVKDTECLRVNVAQYHRRDDQGNILVPGYGKPYPGHVWRAQARLKVWPR